MVLYGKHYEVKYLLVLDIVPFELRKRGVKQMFGQQCPSF